jgi:hypothetical protein
MIDSLMQVLFADNIDNLLVVLVVKLPLNLYIYILLAHLNIGVKKGVVSFESEITGPIGTKFVRNVDWMVLVVVFCLLEVHNETRGQRCKTKKVLSVFVCRTFIFQPILVGFFLLYVPYKMIFI